MSDPVPSWLGTAVTAVIAAIGAAWVLVRRLLSSITREEHAQLMEQMEDRFQQKMDHLEKTLLRLHDDNKDARHRLRDDISAPINNLNANLLKLRESIDRNNGMRG